MCKKETKEIKKDISKLNEEIFHSMCKELARKRGVKLEVEENKNA